MDVFIPSINVGIEYQGLQHYEEIDFFGGKTSLEERKKLDEIKKQKCSEQGIKLIEWKYDLDVNIQSFIDIFKANGISLPDTYDENIDIAAVKKYKRAPRIKEKEVVIPEYVIYQYDNTGKFVNEFNTTSDACRAVGVKSIRKVLLGQQNTAAGYYWRKVHYGTPKEKIAISEEFFAKDKINVKETPTGEAKKVVQIDDDGNEIRAFSSIKEASDVVGVNDKSIRMCLSGKQKHAGGFKWKLYE